MVFRKAPKNQRVHGGKSSRSPGGVPQQSSGSQWDSIIKFLDSLMSRLHENHVCWTFYNVAVSVEFDSLLVLLAIFLHDGTFSSNMVVSIANKLLSRYFMVI